MQVKEIVVAATDVKAKHVVHDTGESTHTLCRATLPGFIWFELVILLSFTDPPRSSAPHAPMLQRAA